MDLSLNYELLKSLHIIFFTTWMAGLFYLPRIYVYHSKEKINSTSYKTFIVMEKKLLKYIMNPSFLLTFITGISLVIQTGQAGEKWFLSKFILVFLMAIFHMYCAKVRKDFEQKKNIKTEKFFRVINEVPTILFILIVLIVVFKPFN
tara:strand:- start:288 stop:728 length:441 start_codon:yes stop_codon:yes gene_type:complete